MTTLKIIFWIGIFLVFYTYIGYGLLLWVLVQLKRMVRGRAAKAVLPADDALPDVTLMICAYNEQDVVDMKMENTHQLDYPSQKLHVMWVTDGTTDDTNQRLARYPEVEIVYTPERKGKTAALLTAKGIKPVGEVEDKFCTALLQGLTHLLVGGIEFTQS